MVNSETVVDILELETILGSETFQTEQAKVNMFCIPNDRAKKEEIIFNAPKRSSEYNVLSQGHVQYRDAVKHYVPGIDAGKWVFSSYSVLDGALMKIAITMHKRNGMQMSVCQFISFRADAAHREIVIPLTGNKHANVQNSIIAGRFDLLSLEEARQLNVNIDDRFRHLFNNDVFSHLTNINIVHPERRPKPRFASKVYKIGDEDVVISKYQNSDGIVLDLGD